VKVIKQRKSYNLAVLSSGGGGNRISFWAKPHSLATIMSVKVIQQLFLQTLAVLSFDAVAIASFAKTELLFRESLCPMKVTEVCPIPQFGAFVFLRQWQSYFGQN